MLEFAFQENVPSYYSYSKNIEISFDPLTKNLDADVCIIGAGFTGLSAAIELAEQGKSVIVLEGARVGFGASGRSGGQAISGFDEGLLDYIEEIGLEKTRAIWDMSLEAVDIIHQRCKKFNIDCHWQAGYATVANSEKDVEYLDFMKKVHSTLFDYHQYELWDKTKLEQNLGSKNYQGALFDPLSGHIHPLNYCLGLAQAADSLGVQIFEQSPVIDLEKGEVVSVIGADFKVKAKNVILATNAYITELSKKITQGIEKKIIPVESFIIATEPLTDEMADSVIKNRMAICDSNYLLDYYRLSKDNRLLFGSDASKNVDMIAKMRQNMLDVFPHLEDIKIDFGWAGPIDMTMNATPHFGQVDNIYFAQGFSGHGVALTGLAGRIITEAILGDTTRLEIFESLNIPTFYGGKYAKKVAAKMGVQYYKFLDKYF